MPASDVASQCEWACVEVTRATPECVVAALLHALKRLPNCSASVPAPLSCLSSAIVDITVCSQAFFSTGNIYLPHNHTDSLAPIDTCRHTLITSKAFLHIAHYSKLWKNIAKTDKNWVSKLMWGKTMKKVTTNRALLVFGQQANWEFVIWSNLVNQPISKRTWFWYHDSPTQQLSRGVTTYLLKSGAWKQGLRYTALNKLKKLRWWCHCFPCFL